MAARVVQRTPNLGITLRMQRQAAAAAPDAAPPKIRLGWWNPDSGRWDRTEEAVELRTYVWPPRAVPPQVVALLLGAASGVEVTWTATWGPPGGGDPQPLALPHTGEGCPWVLAQGPVVAVAVNAEEHEVGILTLSASQGGVSYGPITLVVTYGYY